MASLRALDSSSEAPFHHLPARIWQKIVLGFGIAVLMLATIAFVAHRSTRGLIASVQSVAHSRQVLENEESFLRHWMEADSAARGYLLAADEQFLPGYEAAQTAIIEDYKTLKNLTAENPRQQERIAQLKPLLSRKFSILKAAITSRREEGIDAATALMSDGNDQSITLEMRKLMLDFVGEEETILARRAGLASDIARTATVIIVSGSVLSGVILVLAAAVILRDVAARRRAEEALAQEHNLLRSVIDAMPEHVFVKDLVGRYVIDNRAHRRFLGVGSLREVEGKSAEDFFPASEVSQFAEDDETVIATGQGIINREVAIISRDGNVMWLATTKMPLRDIDGVCTGLVCVSSDISIRKQAEERLRLTAEQLRRSNHELEEFASVASHDLQEPLRKIQAFGDRLKTKCGPGLGADGMDYLGRMQDAARRMQILLQDLLTLSRVTSKAQPFVPVSLEKIVNDVVSDLEVRIELSGARVETGFLPTIEADPSQMRQLFQNLIANALKFQRGDTEPEVVISSKLLDMMEQQLPGATAGDEVCQIRVSDNGIGFDDKYAERIFQVFQRLHSRSEYEGTGIGLAVCRKITERHGGTITAKSSEGQGATFIVTLPVKQSIKSDPENIHETTR